MNRKIIGIFIVISLFGCSTTNINDSNVSGKKHSLVLDTNKKLLFNTTGCKLEGGTLKNEADFASAGSYGTLAFSNSKSKAVLDQFHFSCGATAAGGVSSCVIQHVDGDGTFRGYGGTGCPDMSFAITKFRAF